MAEKYVKVMQEPRETILDYIKRLDTMQKSVSDDTVYYGYYEDENANESYFNGKDLPLVEFEAEYKYFNPGPGNIIEIMKKLKTLLSERVNDGEDIHLYTIFDSIGFVSGEELLFSDDIEKLFKDKLASRNMLAKEYRREDEERESAEKEAQNKEKASIKEKYVKVSKNYKEEIIDYIKRLSELQQSAPENTVYYGFYENENGETYLNGKNLPPVDFEKNYIYVPDGPGSIPEQMENLRNALSERVGNGQDIHAYALYGNIGLVTSEELLQCKSAEDINKLFEEHFEAQKKLRHIDMLFENDR